MKRSRRALPCQRARDEQIADYVYCDPIVFLQIQLRRFRHAALVKKKTRAVNSR